MPRLSFKSYSELSFKKLKKTRWS